MKKEVNELTVEITSDFVCPWCFIGEARLEKALEQVAPNITVKKVWRPYELRPDMPLEGRDRVEFMNEKFGPGKLEEMDQRMKGIGAEDGVEFNQSKIKRSPNTRLAHRLMILAAKEGRETELARRLFKAYFTDGEDIGKLDVLTRIAADAGMNLRDVEKFLNSKDGVREVEEMEAQGRARGIQGVPYIRVGNEEIRGAELVEDMAAAIERALASRQAA